MKINERLFNVAAKFISHNEVRYYLRGVYIEPCPTDGTVMVATDGTKLICIHDCEGKTDSGKIVAPPYEKRMLIDGTFPDWRQLLKQFRAANLPTGPGSFNSSLIAAFAEAGGMLKGNPETPLRIISHGPADPALVLWPDIPYAFGMLMPMRTKDDLGLPEWLESPAPTPEPIPLVAAYGW